MLDLELPASSSYIFGAVDAEDRSQVSTRWMANQSSTQFLAVVEVDDETVEVGAASGSVTIHLHNQPEIERWIEHLVGTIFLDITGLSFRVWAPILRALCGTDRKFRLVYVEPLTYKRATGMSGGFDITELTEGVAPLPGFARIADLDDGPKPFVPMLGFEGNRLGRIIQRFEPADDSIYPVLGVPGYQYVFPFYSLVGNRQQLETGFMHSRIVLARANCPFDALFALDSIRIREGGGPIQVAPIGTKPHAIGAALFAILRPNVELIYDHPRRAVQPSSGASRTCVYYVSDFLHSRSAGSGVVAA